MVASDSNYAQLRREAEEDFEDFWARAAEELPWFRKWDKVFESDYPSFRWFPGAQTNLAYNCLDHHVKEGAGDHVALIYANELGARQTFTYAELTGEVERVAAALRGMGLTKGDRLTIYMPNCPEAAILMLATVRIGAIHSVVFAGFGSQALADRINASGSRLVFTADVAYRKGSTVELKPLVDGAMDLGCDLVERVVVLKRREGNLALVVGRDMFWDEFLEQGAGQSSDYVLMEANDPAYILATSGTTATPKLVVHTQGGYQVGVHSMGRWCYGLKPSDVWWATSDLGWVVGHSYIVYGPLMSGAASILYEGALDYPAPDVLWRLVEEFKVTGIFTSPTAVRLLMRTGEEYAKGRDISSLERVICAGEVLNPPVLEWLEQRIFDGKVPVIDHWWQTETGAPVIGNPYGLGMIPIKAGSAGVPLPGMEIAIMSMEGKECAPGEKGILVIKRSFPNLTATIWGDPERYSQDYWQKIDGFYFTGDLASIDEDGYVWFSGRADEVIKIAAHRIGSVEVETAFMRHEAVAEAGVTGRPDELRGEVIAGFIILKNGYTPSEQLKTELQQVVRKELGPVAVIGDINFVNMLPKTRSGKTMRRVLKAITLNTDPGDITTIEDEGSVEEARQAWQQLKGDVASQP